MTDFDPSSGRAADVEWAFAAVAAILVAGALFVLRRPLVLLLSPRPSEHECSELVERHLDQALRQRKPGLDDVTVAKAVVAARGTPEHRRDVQRCRRQLTQQQVRCGVAAPDVDALERCVQ